MLRTLIFLLMIATAISGISQVAPEAKDISPLLIGEQIPDIKMTSSSGKVDAIMDLVKDSPTVLVFYRGGWCPFCNVHLAEMNNIKEDIIGLGFQIIAIGTDSPEKLKNTISDQQLEYQLYSDADTQISQAFGIAFEASERKKEQLKESSDGKNPGNLPVPSVFVIDKQGLIQFEYINPDYKTRLKGDMLLAILKVLNN